MKRVVVGVVFASLLLAITATSSAAPACQGPGQECKTSADCCGSLNCLPSRNPRETGTQRCY